MILWLMCLGGVCMFCEGVEGWVVVDFGGIVEEVLLVWWGVGRGISWVDEWLGVCESCCVVDWIEDWDLGRVGGWEVDWEVGCIIGVIDWCWVWLVEDCVKILVVWWVVLLFVCLFGIGVVCFVVGGIKNEISVEFDGWVYGWLDVWIVGEVRGWVGIGVIIWLSCWVWGIGCWGW